MSLKPCKECHQLVSTRAKRCPHCGTDNPRIGKIARFITTALAMAIVIPIGAVVINFFWKVVMALLGG